MMKHLALLIGLVFASQAQSQQVFTSSLGLSAASSAFTCTAAGVCTLSSVSSIGTSLAVGGATIGANALAVAGTSVFRGAASTVVNVVDSTGGGNVLQQFTASAVSKGYIGYVPTGNNGIALLTGAGSIALQVQDSNLAVFFGGAISIATVGATGAGDVSACVTTTGAVTKGATCGVSSSRFKRDVADISPKEAARVVEHLEPKSFKYQKEFTSDSSVHFGLLAERTAEVLSDLAIMEDDGVTPRSVKYNEIMPFVLAYTKTLAARLKVLEDAACGHC